METEDDPIAALVARRVAQMKEADGAPSSDAPNESIRIEVPVFSEMGHVHMDLSEQWVADVPEPEEEIAPPVPVAEPTFSASRHNYPALIGIPVLLLLIGLAAYALLRNSPTGEETVRESPSQEISSPESAPVAGVSPAAVEETVSDADATVTTERSISEEPVNSERTEMAESRSFIRRQPETSNSKRSTAERSASPVERRSESSQIRTRDQASSKNQASRTSRPRIVNDQDFEQPPVSSIESIMTGIPTNRSRPQRRWEVLKEDELRRERKIRRINRRNRQKDQLF